MTPEQKHTAGAEIITLVVNFVFDSIVKNELATDQVVRELSGKVNTIIDKHTARLIVPEPSDEDKRLIAGLEAHAKADKHTKEWEWHDDYCKACNCGYESLESDEEGILLHVAAWSMKPEHKKLIAAAPKTAANCDHLIAMNKEINALNDKLQAEKAELVEAHKTVISFHNHVSIIYGAGPGRITINEHTWNAIKEISEAAIANADNEKQKKG